VSLGGAQQLDAVAEGLGHLQVERQQAADALGRDLPEVELAAEGHGGQQRQLVRGIDPLHVEGGIGLGVPQLLGPLEHDLERLLGALHLTEDVVGGTVQDAEHAADLIRRQPLAQGAQHRDPPGDGRLEAHLHALLRRSPQNLRAVGREQRLVRRHHVLAGRDGLERQAARDVVAPDELDDDVDLRGGDQPLRIGVEVNTRKVHATVAFGLDVGNAHQTQRKAQASSDDVGAAREHLGRARADGPEADEPHANRSVSLLSHDFPLKAHCSAATSRLPGAARCCCRKRRIPRTACRIRCLFSTSAKRT
jgi:hypothetical protein